MVLDWCVRIAKGESVWNLPTEKGTVLYLCLEDSLARIQDRLNCITDEVQVICMLQRNQKVLKQA